jgi:cytoplasmic iron level regulating protein YaaA (DUF328/UPF0246 family)
MIKEMIVILSPAKTLDFNREIKTSEYSEPIFKEKAHILIEELRKYSPNELASLMKLNEELSELNFFRYHDWNIEHSLSNSRQAIIAFKGAVFQGLMAEDFSKNQLDFAQKHLRILSGLYGVLKPLDLIEAYRLEMGTKLKNTKGKDLYVFWRDLITDYFNEELGNHKDNFIINLASNEYFSVIDAYKLGSKVIAPVFKEYKQGRYKNITIYAKRARGLMARYIIENEIEDPEDLKNFEEEGYEYNESLSKDNQPVFTR